MCKVVLSSISDFPYNAIKYNLTFSDLTYLSGDSATGKTLLVSAIKAYASLHNIHLVTFDYSFNPKDVLTYLKNTKDAMIVIDNADLILDDAARDYISTDDNNQYLIIGRNPEGLYIHDEIAKRLVFENKTFSFAPLF